MLMNYHIHWRPDWSASSKVATCPLRGTGLRLAERLAALGRRLIAKEDAADDDDAMDDDESLSWSSESSKMTSSSSSLQSCCCWQDAARTISTMLDRFWAAAGEAAALGSLKAAELYGDEDADVAVVKDSSSRTGPPSSPNLSSARVEAVDAVPMTETTDPLVGWWVSKDTTLGRLWLLLRLNPLLLLSVPDSEPVASSEAVPLHWNLASPGWGRASEDSKGSLAKHLALVPAHANHLAALLLLLLFLVSVSLLLIPPTVSW
jgi:hypothetical protein